jgi:predicted ATPase/Tfp pilus assembly protein PilF
MRLPLQLTRFFGREQEIAEVERMLNSGEVRLLTITGPGGTGKTRLALEVVPRLTAKFHSEIYFVPLADVTDPQLVSCTILKSLSIKPSGEIEPLAQIEGALRHKPALIVLDNYEQLPYEAAETVQALLERLPQLSIIVTSRSCLGIGGEQEFPLTPLPVPSATVTTDQITGFSSARMFVDRARAVRPDFRVTPANVSATAALCAKLEGIPLAIELAAGWAQTQTPAQMLERLGRRFDVLTSRRKDLAPRHRTLRATVEWSYRLLSPELQRLFARLSVFRGGWTLESAEAIVLRHTETANDSTDGSEAALEMLAQLRERSLIGTDEVHGVIRYRLLETLREYASEQLEPEEEEQLHSRHARYFLEFAEQSEEGMRGPEQAAWVDRVDVEHDNLQAAIRRCAEAGDRETGLRIAAAITGFWHARGYPREGLNALQSLLTDDPTISPRTRAKAIAARATLQRLLGDLPLVIQLYEQALALFEQVGDKRSMAEVLQRMHSPVYFHLRKFEPAAALLERSLALSREINDTEGVATALAGLANLTRDQGDVTRARDIYEESIALYRSMGHTHGVSRVLADLGYMLTGQADYDAALEMLEEALSLSRQLNNRVSIGHILWLLGRLKDIQGDYHAATVFLEDAVKVARESGNQQQVFNATTNLAIVAENEGDYSLAKERYAIALVVAEEMRDRWMVAASRLEIARISMLLGQLQEAVSTARLALETMATGGPSWRLFGCIEVIARSLGHLGKPEASLRLLGAIETHRLQFGAPYSSQEVDELQKRILPPGSTLSAEQIQALRSQGADLTLADSVSLAMGETLR